MRHNVGHRKLGRVTEHRIAMLRNQATSLIHHEHLTTTVAKAKELRPFVEQLITVAKRGIVAGSGNALSLDAGTGAVTLGAASGLIGQWLQRRPRAGFWLDRLAATVFVAMLLAGFVPFLAFAMERYTEKNLVPRRPQ